MVNFSSKCGVSLFWGHLVRYLIFAITPRRVHRLSSFFDMMRISSSATTCTKGVFFFVQPFWRNWPRILAPFWPPEEMNTKLTDSKDSISYSFRLLFVQKLFVYFLWDIWSVPGLINLSFLMKFRVVN